MADFVFQGVQAKEAIQHIRQKKLISTERYDQWMGAANAKGFVVAGATKMALVEDLHSAVLQAKTEGQSLKQFREAFAEIAHKHGWSYRGEEGWRAKTIYQNNMRTAAMAGRWQQIQENKELFPYLIYMTAGDERVRADHKRWHYICLPVDDPFWDKFYPPNGWGCRCYVIQATEKQLKRMGIQVSDSPKIQSTERVIPSTGEVYGDVPEGIDTGWEYNVGKAWTGPEESFAKRLAQLPHSLRREALEQVASTATTHQINEAWKTWFLVTEKQEQKVGSSFVIGWIDPQTLDLMDIKPANLSILVNDGQLEHLKGGHKPGKNIPQSVLENLPNHLASATAALRDINTGNIVYVLAADGRKRSRMVVAVGRSRKGDKINTVRSLGSVDVSNLKQAPYELLWGEL